jgi:hypothetical protein
MLNGPAAVATTFVRLTKSARFVFPSRVAKMMPGEDEGPPAALSSAATEFSLVALMSEMAFQEKAGSHKTTVWGHKI